MARSAPAADPRLVEREGVDGALELLLKHPFPKGPPAARVHFAESVSSMVLRLGFTAYEYLYGSGAARRCSAGPCPGVLLGPWAAFLYEYTSLPFAFRWRGAVFALGILFGPPTR